MRPLRKERRRVLTAFTERKISHREKNMIGIWREYSGIYLYFLSIGTALFFGLPLLFWPIKWARILKWQIPEQQDLAIYFGRCLGGVICVLAFFAFKAGKEQAVQPFYFNIILANFAVMVIVHLYGAIRKIQPISETIE